MSTALHRLRLARGQSLRQLAADVGLSYQTLARIERGEAVCPHPRTRVVLEQAFELPFDVLTAPVNASGANVR
jgi:transcriptional regulator with XRE-family HTH domain